MYGSLFNMRIDGQLFLCSVGRYHTSIKVCIVCFLKSLQIDNKQQALTSCCFSIKQSVLAGNTSALSSIYMINTYIEIYKYKSKTSYFIILSHPLFLPNIKFMLPKLPKGGVMNWLPTQWFLDSSSSTSGPPVVDPTVTAMHVVGCQNVGSWIGS